MCVDGDDHDLGELLDAFGTFPPVETSLLSSGATTSDSFTGAAALNSLSSIPALNSLPGAAVSLYLDFDGDFVSSWGAYSNITTPVFDQDGDPNNFSDSELSNILKIWSYVAEDYAPFNINVTTVQPASFANGIAERVDIGGDGAWTGGRYGGVSYVNSFTGSIENVSFVFPKNLGSAKSIGDASSHEAGHGFGLYHQSLYSGTTKVAEYYSGPGNGTAPIMGNSYSAQLSRWWYGTSTSSTTYQDDMAVISRPANGFGYRTDDHGNTAANATPLNVSGSQVSGSGIIEQTTDLDTFSFTTGAGAVSLSVGVPAGVNNLAPKIELRDFGGSVVIASAGPNASYSATITTTLAAGSYRLVVMSNGGYGNVGQYSVSGTIVTGNIVNAPANLTATTISTSHINLAWTDNASNETGYTVERSLDGLAWSTIAAGLLANSTTYADTAVAPGTTYSYRVSAFNTSLTSDYSNQATATTITVAPSLLTAAAASSSRIDLTWADVSGETSFRVERSLDGLTWSLVGTTAAGVTNFADTSVSPSATYQYRVQAVNTGGGSAYSNVAGATTPAAPVAPTAPSGLVAAARSPTSAILSWHDNSGNESGFLIERSANGGKSWSQIVQVGANVTSYVDGGLNSRKTYLYRVRAFNGGGNSAYSNVATITMPAKASDLPTGPTRSADPARADLTNRQESVSPVSGNWTVVNTSSTDLVDRVLDQGIMPNPNSLTTARKRGG
jgi:fibronectin type 3 domain-containing protein